jgi:hypothetical protein
LLIRCQGDGVLDTLFVSPTRRPGKSFRHFVKIKSGPELQKLEKTQSNIYLKKLRDEHNLLIRQIARLTGINRGIVCQAYMASGKCVKNPVPLTTHQSRLY